MMKRRRINDRQSLVENDGPDLEHSKHQSSVNQPASSAPAGQSECMASGIAARAKKRQNGGESIQRTPYDILCGRGIPIQNYHGNIRLHRILDSYRDEYLATDRRDKSALIRRIVAEIKEGGARFLKRKSTFQTSTEDPWEEMDDNYAYEKISHALRCRRYTENAKYEEQKAPPLAGSVSSYQTGKSERPLNQQQSLPIHTSCSRRALHPSSLGRTNPGLRSLLDMETQASLTMPQSQGDSTPAIRQNSQPNASSGEVQQSGISPLLGYHHNHTQSPEFRAPYVSEFNRTAEGRINTFSLVHPSISLASLGANQAQRSLTPSTASFMFQHSTTGGDSTGVYPQQGMNALSSPASQTPEAPHSLPPAADQLFPGGSSQKQPDRNTSAVAPFPPLPLPLRVLPMQQLSTPATQSSADHRLLGRFLQQRGLNTTEVLLSLLQQEAPFLRQNHPAATVEAPSQKPDSLPSLVSNSDQLSLRGHVEIRHHQQATTNEALLESILRQVVGHSPQPSQEEQHRQMQQNATEALLSSISGGLLAGNQSSTIFAGGGDSVLGLGALSPATTCSTISGGRQVKSQAQLLGAQHQAPAAANPIEALLSLLLWPAGGHGVPNSCSDAAVSPGTNFAAEQVRGEGNVLDFVNNLNGPSGMSGASGPAAEAALLVQQILLRRATRPAETATMLSAGGLSSSIRTRNLVSDADPPKDIGKRDSNLHNFPK